MKKYSFSKNKDNRKIKINKKNAIIYMCILLGVVWGKVFINGYMFLYMLVVFCALPIASIVSLVMLDKNINFILSMEEKEIHKNTCVSIGLIIKNKSFFASPFCKIRMTLGNEFYKSNRDVEYKMTIAPKGKSKTSLPLELNKCGVVKVIINNIEYSDVLALFSYVYMTKMEEDICVIPLEETISDVDKGSFTEGLTQNEENNLKGSDFSDVSNIREYVPGDRIKDIHWKATAKKDELMVKERVRLSENQLALLVDMSCDKESIEEVLALSFNVIRHAIDEGVPVLLMWWDDVLNTLQETEIMNRNDINRGFVELFQSGISTNTSLAIDYIRNVKVKLKNYIIVKAQGEAKICIMD